MASQKSLNEFELTILDNMRKIRNDIQYHGSKSDKDIEEFYEMNKEEIMTTLRKLKEFVQSQL